MLLSWYYTCDKCNSCSCGWWGWCGWCSIQVICVTLL